MLWWTWIGFAVFYNRYGDVDSLWQRLFVVVATVPCGLAAVAVHDLAEGHRTAFALSLAGARLMLALAHLAIGGGALARRIGIGYLLSAALFTVSVFLPDPAWWLVWAAAMAVWKPRSSSTARTAAGSSPATSCAGWTAGRRAATCAG